MTSRRWALPKILESDQVAGAELLGQFCIKITSKKGHVLIVAVIEDRVVERDSVSNVLSEGNSPDIVITVPKTAIWKGTAINLIKDKNLGWGGLGEALRAIDFDDIGSIQKKEYQFVERGLDQHQNVRSYERVYDRVYYIHRNNNLPALTVALVNGYELTSEHIRNARQVYGKFDIALNTNPNGSITNSAKASAKEIPASILKWGDFLGRLNKP